MVISIALILLVAALILIIVSAIGKCPLWIPVLLICVVALLNYLPVK